MAGFKLKPHSNPTQTATNPAVNFSGITKYKHGKLPMPRCVDGERSLLPLTICPTPQALKEVHKLLADPTVSALFLSLSTFFTCS